MVTVFSSLRPGGRHLPRTHSLSGAGEEPRGPALDWTVRISDERGNLLLQTPETHSPAGEWRCVDAPRESLAVPGEAGTGRVQVAARQIVKAPAGTKPSEINGSFEVVNDDGTTAGAVAGVLYAALHSNDL